MPAAAGASPCVRTYRSPCSRIRYEFRLHPGRYCGARNCLVLARRVRYTQSVTLTPYADVSAAAWITSSDLPWQQLVAFGPSGFEAYARLRFLPDPTYPGQSESDLDADAPSVHELLRTTLEVLRQHTRAPDDCYFCLWDGWGADIVGNGGAWIPILNTDTRTPPEIYRDAQEPTRSTRPSLRIAPAFPPSVLNGPKVVIPNRAYFLFHGTLSEFGDWGAADTSPDHPRSGMPPAFVWPADHAWCIANDIDSHYAGIGADSTAIDQLLAHPRLDVVPADPRMVPPHYG
jgi:hypothetical protein